MKEKRILLAMLLSVAFQADAGRSPAGKSADTDTDKPVVADRRDYRKVTEEPKEDAKPTKKAKEKKKPAPKKEETAPSAKKMDREMTKAGIKAEKAAKLKAEKDEADRLAAKKAKKDKELEKRQADKQEEYVAKEAERKQMHAHNKTDDYDVTQARAAREERILKHTIAQLEHDKYKLEDKLAAAKEEMKKEDEEKDDDKKHQLNKTTPPSVKVETHQKDIRDIEDKIAMKKDALEKLSPIYKEDAKKEVVKRQALQKIYEKKQDKLRAQLKDVEKQITALKNAERKAKGDLQDDKETYEPLVKLKRDAATVKDAPTRMDLEKAMGERQSDEMTVLMKKKQMIVKQLENLRVKMTANDKNLAAAEKEAGMEKTIKQEHRDRKTDELVKNEDEKRAAGDKRVEKTHYFFSDTSRKVKDRREELAAKEDDTTDIMMPMATDKKPAKKKAAVSEKKKAKKNDQLPGQVY